MTKASDNLFPKVILNEAATDGSDFSNPSADYRVFFLGEDGALHLKDSAGTVTDVGGGDVATDAIWDAAGDLAVGSGANTAAKLTVGTADQVLTVVSGAPAWRGFIGARAYAATTTTTTTGNWVSVAFNSERFDTSTFHDTSTNNSRLTIPADGYYLVGGNAQFAGNTTGQRAIRLYVSNTTRIAEELTDTVSDGALPTRMSIVTLYYFTAAQYVELQLFQDSGGDIATENTANSTAEFWITKLG